MRGAGKEHVVAIVLERKLKAPRFFLGTLESRRTYQVFN